MNKTTVLGLLTIMLVGLLTTGLVSAYRGNPNVEGPNFSEERHLAMQEAMETADYNAWYKLISENERNPRVLELVTEENFALFAKAHEAAKNGDFETAKELRAEIGLNNGNEPKDGTGYRKGMKASDKGQRLNKRLFVDSDNDGLCDNIGSKNNFRIGKN